MGGEAVSDCLIAPAHWLPAFRSQGDNMPYDDYDDRADEEDETELEERSDDDFYGGDYYDLADSEFPSP